MSGSATRSMEPGENDPGFVAPGRIRAGHDGGPEGVGQVPAEGDGPRTGDARLDAPDAPGTAGQVALTERCAIWGVLNVTPDSFSDGGRYLAPEAALAHARAMVAAGADVIDVGGESSRPKGKTYGAGFEVVDADEERRRVIPVVEALVAEGIPVSVDTVKGAVARPALAAGARFVNDVSMGADAALLEAVAEAGAELVLMHTRARGGCAPGEVRPPNSVYADVVEETRAELEEAAGRAEAAGVGPERVWLDPGIGFAKTAEQSAAVLAATARFVAGGRPVLIGASRKSFIGQLAPRADGTAPKPDERLPGSLVAVTLAVLGGARAVRVHDVAESHQAVRLAERLGRGAVPGTLRGGSR